MPSPLDTAVLFSFEKKQATVKELLKKLAATGQFQVEYHEDTVVIWKKADDALLNELTQQLKTPAFRDAIAKLGQLADPRIYPLLFQLILDDRWDAHTPATVELNNAHRDTMHFGQGVDVLVEPMLARFQKKERMRSFWYALVVATHSKRFVEPLMRIVNDVTEPDTERQAAAGCVAELGDTSSVPALIRLLQEGDPKDAAIQAAWALPTLNEPRGLDALLALAKDPRAERRQLAAYTLNRFHDPRVGEALLELIKDSVPAIAHDAASRLAEYPSPRAIAALLQLAQHDKEDPATRSTYWRFSSLERDRTAAEVLGSYSDPSAFEALKQLAQAQEPAVRARAAQGLAINRSPEAVALLIGFLSDADAKVRELSAEALGLTRDDRALPTLLAHIKDADAGLRSGVALGLAQSRDPRAFDALQTLAQDADAGVRSSAAMALSLVPDRRATPILARLARDADDEVEQTACQALAESADPHAADELIACVNDANPKVVKNAKDALPFSKDQRLINLNFSLNLKDLNLKDLNLSKPKEAAPQPEQKKEKDEF